jgi:outer membrane receptor protein involved in Fe transport
MDNLQAQVTNRILVMGRAGDGRCDNVFKMRVSMSMGHLLILGVILCCEGAPSIANGTGRTPDQLSDSTDEENARFAKSERGENSAESGRSESTSADTNSDSKKVERNGKRSPRIEEVVVTAQKRSESLQDVPISAQVIGSAVLADQNQNTLEDLTQMVPGVHVRSGGTGGGADIFIRGIGSGTNRAFDQSVATFVDDIFHGRSSMSGATFLDLDRIEVLKGPQSTFFGNNAIAGAFNIVSKKPGKEFDSWVRGLYGQYGQYVADGAIGGPVTELLGARLALTANGGSGWLENVSTGREVPRINNVAGRLTVEFTPGENLNATLKVEGSRNRTAGSSVGQPLQWGGCPPPPPYTSDFVNFCPQAIAANATAPGSVPIGLSTNKTVGLPGQENHLSTFEDVLTINYEKWGHTLTSVSGFYNYHYGAADDGAHLPQYLFSGEEGESYHQFSQELRVASPTDSVIDYLAGVYFQTDHLSVSSAANAPFLNFVTSLGAPFDQLGPYLPLSVGSVFSQGERVYSGFSALGLKIGRKVKLNAGIRGSWVDKD